MSAYPYLGQGLVMLIFEIFIYFGVSMVENITLHCFTGTQAKLPGFYVTHMEPIFLARNMKSYVNS